MNLDNLIEILEEKSGNKYCVICGTPFKPYNVRQKTCGSKECQKKYHSIYVNDYNRKLREAEPEKVRKRNREWMRKYRARQKAVDNAVADLDREAERWEKQQKFNEKVAEYGDRYGEEQAKKILERVPKINTDLGGKDNG